MSDSENVNRGPMVLGVTSFYEFLAITAVALRFYSRHISKAGFWWDDWLSLVGLIFVVASNATRYLFVEFGLGRHIGDVDPPDLIRFFQVLYADMIVYTATVLIVKLCAILFYARVFPARNFRRWLWVVAAVVVAWFIGAAGAVIFQCKPIEGFWDHSLHPTCLDFTTLLLGQAVPNIVTDFVLLALPVSSLYHLHLAKAKRVALIIIFILGHFVAVVSIIRLITILKSNPTTQLDATMNLTDPNIWTMTELTVGLMCVCMPATGYLFRDIIRRLPISTSWKDSTGRSRGKSTNATLSRVTPNSVARDAAWRTLDDDDSIAQDSLKHKDSHHGSSPGDDIEMSLHSIKRTDLDRTGRAI